MVNTCCVKDCFSRGGRDKVRFFRIPKVKKHHDNETKELTEKRRKKWLDNINPKNVTTENADAKRVCSKHFTDSKHYDFFKLKRVNS